MSALAARGICKSFGRRQVLNGLDLDVASGELVAVVGENGTGKTTLLRILAGDLRPDAGSVAATGRPGHGPGRGPASTIHRHPASDADGGRRAGKRRFRSQPG